jgi:hypothetical protein
VEAEEKKNRFQSIPVANRVSSKRPRLRRLLLLRLLKTMHGCS